MKKMILILVVAVSGIVPGPLSFRVPLKEAAASRLHPCSESAALAIAMPFPKRGPAALAIAMPFPKRGPAALAIAMPFPRREPALLTSTACAA